LNDHTPISDAALLAWIEGLSSGQSRAAVERALEQDPALAKCARAMRAQRGALTSLGEADIVSAPADLAARAIDTAEGLAAAEPDLAALAALDDSSLGELPRSKVGSLREPAPWSIAGLRRSIAGLPGWTRPLAAAAALTIAAAGLLYAGWSSFDPTGPARSSGENQQIARGESNDEPPATPQAPSAEAGLPIAGTPDHAGGTPVSGRSRPLFKLARSGGSAGPSRSVSAARAADAARRGSLGIVLTASDLPATRAAIASLEGVVSHDPAPSGLAIELPLHAVPLGDAIDADAERLADRLVRLAAAAGDPEAIALEIGSTPRTPGPDATPALTTETGWFATPDDVFWWSGGAEAFAGRFTVRVPIAIVTPSSPER